MNKLIICSDCGAEIHPNGDEDWEDMYTLDEDGLTNCCSAYALIDAGDEDNE